MNPVIQSLMRHRSIRHYLDKPVEESAITAIVKAAQAAPNWNNFQLVSIISVKNPDRRKTMSELCGKQPYVAQAPVFLIFCADYYRVWLAMDKNSATMKTVLDDIDTALVGAHEAAISAATAVVAAEALGLGTVCIGDVRLNPLEMIRELKLPPYVFPVVGLCVGYPAGDPGIKPRLPQEAVYFEENYNPDLQSFIDTYDETYAHYLATRASNERSGSWSEQVNDFYSKPFHYPYTEAMLKQQGFLGGSEKE